MKDMLMQIYNSLLANSAIKTSVYDAASKKHNIMFYDTPDGKLPDTFILIRPMRPPQAAVEGSDQTLATDLRYQIDVQSTGRMNCKNLQHEIIKQMESLGFSRMTGSENELDDYFSDSKHYIDARRFVYKKIYDNDY